MGLLSRACAVVSFACALAIACGGAIDASSAIGMTGGASTGDPDADAAITTAPPSRPDAHPPSSKDCSSRGVSCQIFEPGGPSRWGCHTVGPEPELTCEHAADAAIARCNCNGRFGESPPGVDSGITWFDIPATSTFFSEQELLRLWRDLCHGTCR